MPDYARRPAPALEATGPQVHAPEPESVWDRLSNAWQNLLLAEQNKPEVVLYATLNSTTHHRDELTEALAALDQGEAEGLGKRHLLPISDPYNLGTSKQRDTYAHALGQNNADKLTFWHDDPDLEEGEIRLNGGAPIMLGTENLDLSKPDDLAALEQVRQGWDAVLAEMGMDDAYRAKTLEALLGSAKDPRQLGSGDGGTNELLQFVMAMYRAEKGEYHVKSIVLSGHHFNAGRDDLYPEGGDKSGQGIWGEFSNGDYDAWRDDGLSPGGDFFGFTDVEALKHAFPRAYSQVESVQLAACNTHNLGMTDEAGNTLSTEAWLQGTFENIERASYWQGLAPLARTGAWSNGEFLLDDMREGRGGQEDAFNEVVSKRSGSNVLVRSELDPDGKLSRIPDKDLKVDRNHSYARGKGNKLRAKDQDFWTVNEGDREHLYTAGDEEIGSSPEEEAFHDALGDIWKSIWRW